MGKLSGSSDFLNLGMTQMGDSSNSSISKHLAGGV